MAQLVEHILGKDEVPSSNLGSSSRMSTPRKRSAFLILELLLRSELGFVRRTNPVRNPRFAQQRRYLGLRRKTQSCSHKGIIEPLVRVVFFVLELLLRSELGFVRRTNPVRNPRFAQQRRYLGLRRKTQSCTRRASIELLTRGVLFSYSVCKKQNKKRLKSRFFVLFANFSLQNLSFFLLFS